MHQAILVEHVSPFSPVAMQMLHRFSHITGGGEPIHAAQVALQLAYNLVGQQAAILAYLDEFRHFGFLMLMIVPLIFLLKRAAADKGTGMIAVH